MPCRLFCISFINLHVMLKYQSLVFKHGSLISKRLKYLQNPVCMQIGRFCSCDQRSRQLSSVMKWETTCISNLLHLCFLQPAGSSSQALYLLGLFRDFCDDENRAHFISSLSELPANMLMRTDSESGEAVPSVFLVALLTLLDFESCSEDSFSNSSSAFLRSVELKTEEPLAVAHFKQLIKISEDFNCPQLDTAVLRLLQKSLMYVLASTTTLLDSCLDHPTEAKIAVAAHLVAHSPALRSHFELRCLGRPSSKKIKLSVKTSPLEFKDHLKEFLPLVSSYVFCVHGMERDTSGMLQHWKQCLFLSLTCGIR